MNSVGIQIDASQFNTALKKYLLTTSKDAEDALNGKMRDILFQSCKACPIADPGPAKVRDIRAVAMQRTMNKNGLTQWKGIKKSDYPFTALDLDHAIAKIKRPSRGYMKSAFSKAGFLFKQTQASQIAPPSITFMKHKGTKAKTKMATVSFLEAVSELFWNSLSAADREGKKGIAEFALQKGITAVYTDMITYLNKKAAERAKEISAK